MTEYVTNPTTSFDNNAAMGLYGGTAVGAIVRRVTGLGNASIGTITAPAFADVWSGAGQYPFMTGATSLEVVSASANDAAAGTGARTIVLAGLDVNYAELSATITLNGTTPVAIPNSWFRINLCAVTGAGSGLVNAGQITIRDAGAGTTRAIVPAGLGVSQQSTFTVPAGHMLLIRSVEMEINSSAGGGGGTTKGADCSFYFGSPAAANPFYRLTRKMSCTDMQPYPLVAYTTIPVSEKIDFMMRCTYTSAPLILTAAWEAQLFRRIP